MKFLTEKAKKLECYDGGEQPTGDEWTLLHYNELQYPPSPEVSGVISYFANNLLNLRRYYDADAKDLCAAIAKRLGLNPKNIRADSGSNAVLSIIFQAFLSGKRVGIPDVSFGFYKIWSNFYDVKTKYIPLREDFSIDLNDYKELDAVLFPNPNAPTGLALPTAEIENFVRANPDTLVIIDEAYINFADIESCTGLISKYDNILVTQTFSKSYGLANLRIGFVAGNEKLIKTIAEIQGSTLEFSLSEIAQKVAASALNDKNYYDGIIENVKATRERVTAELSALGFKIIPSQTNFLFVKCKNGKELFDYLTKNKILVRRWEQPRIKDYLRITIGTDKQMDDVLKCVKAYLNKTEGV